MAHSKNKKQSNQKKETREERRARLEAETAAREFCFQIFPYVGAAIFILLVSFALWVHTVPPQEYTFIDQVSLDPDTMKTSIVEDGGDIVVGGADMMNNAAESEADESTIEL